MPVRIQVEDREVQVGLGELHAAVTDYPALLKIAGELMRASVARTFREEGSPSGSWPALAASTLKKKGYSAGHKLLILSGRLFGSITYAVTGNTLIVGTNLVYAAVQQYGSADRGGSIGPQARIAGRDVAVSGHQTTRVNEFKRYGKDSRVDKNGRLRSVRVRAQDPSNAARFTVEAHRRFQNIPARPYLVFRPEDPSRIARGMEAYLLGHSVRIGKIGGAAAAVEGAI